MKSLGQKYKRLKINGLFNKMKISVKNKRLSFPNNGKQNSRKNLEILISIFGNKFNPHHSDMFFGNFVIYKVFKCFL